MQQSSRNNMSLDHQKENLVKSPTLKPITILGAGSWGTALALYLARRGQIVRLWSIETSEINNMLADKANNQYLPGYSFPNLIQPIAELDKAVNQVEDVLIVVPSQGFRQTLTLLKPYFSPSMRMICATKGLDAETGQLLSEVATEIMGKEHKFAVLSGPSFAREVAQSLPTAVNIASKDKSFLAELVKRFDSPLFRICPSDDVIGVEVGGVVKNVIAIATGISDGMKLGANARSALITQGLAEIMRLGVALGAKEETLVGLSGLGDLILTCSDNQSRNRRFGLAIGEGKDLEQAIREIGQVVEGKRNAELLAILAKRNQVELPICQTVYQIMEGKLNANEAKDYLLTHISKNN